MTHTIRNAAIIAVLFLLGSCVGAGRIQQREPVRTTTFTGSHKFVAQCVQQRLGGRVQDENFGEKYVIYNSAKREADQGLTHYSITVARTGPDQGVAEWRIVAPPEASPYDGAVRSIPGGGQTRGGLTDASVQRYWAPVQDCAALAKSKS